MGRRLRTFTLAVLAAAALTAGAARAEGPVFAVVPDATAPAPGDAALPDILAPHDLGAIAEDGRLAARLDEFLRSQGSPMAGSGSLFVAAGRRHGIDPRYLVALSGAESSFGKFLFRPFNPFGWGYFTFSSWGEAVETVARGLERGYLAEGRVGVFSIAEKYAPVGADNDPNGTNGEEPHNVAKFLAQLGGNAKDIRFGAGGGDVLGAAPVFGPPKTYWGNSIGAQAASLALEYVGVPYVWGGETPSGFDCSGLTMYVYGRLGVQLNHWTGDQVNQGVEVSLADAQPGDLLFFDLEGGAPQHEGMYVGNGLMVHAPHTGDIVRVVPLDDRYRSRFVSAIRPY